MFKKLFGGDKGGGGGTSSSRPPAAPRANATQGTVDAIQKLGEVRLIPSCKCVVHKHLVCVQPAPFTGLKWQCALPQVHHLPAQCTGSLLRLCTASCQLCPAPAQRDTLPSLQAYEMMEKKYNLLEKKMNECQEKAREYMQAKNKRGDPCLAASSEKAAGLSSSEALSYPIAEPSLDVSHHRCTCVHTTLLPAPHP